MRLADDFAESNYRLRTRSEPRAVWFVRIDRLCLPLFHRDFGQHFVEVVVEADGLFGFFLPVKVRHGIFRRSALLKRDNGGAVGRAFKRLEITQVVHLKNFEMRAIAELKTTEAVARAFGFEQRLRDDETQPPAVLHIIIKTGVCEKHCQIFFAAAESRGLAGKREKAVVLPKLQRLVAIGIGKALPVDPRRIADKKVERLFRSEERRVGKECRSRGSP